MKTLASDPPRIVGIYLVRNEEKYFEQVVTNTYDFCDHLIIAENYSTDSTYDIAQRLAGKSSKIELHRVEHPGHAHALVRPYCDTRTWVFAVDGDEIYDPLGLVRFKEELITGTYDDWWILFGNVLNCVEIDKKHHLGTGYLAPPCRSMTKLYNFFAITDWKDCSTERMLGGTILFKEQWNETLRLNIHEEVSWEQALYRCLHVCFLPRSNEEKIRAQGLVVRENPVELQVRGIRKKIRKIIGMLLQRPINSGWKLEKYMRGDLVQKDVKDFFTLRFQDLIQ